MSTQFPKISRDTQVFESILKQKYQIPGVGDYNIEKPAQYLKSRNPQWGLYKENRRLQMTEQPTMRTEGRLPSIGSYNSAKCIDRVSRPYIKKYNL